MMVITFSISRTEEHTVLLLQEVRSYTTSAALYSIIDKLSIITIVKCVTVNITAGRQLCE